jgi:uncharacterized protein
LRSLEIGELRIPLSEVRQGIQDFEFKSALPELQIGIIGEKPHEVDVHVRVTPVGEEFLVELSAAGLGDFNCDRCGEPVRQTLQGQVKTLFIHGPTTGDSEATDEVRFITPENQTIDVQQDAVDALLLAVPVKVLCRESCKGLCPSCGRNLNEGSCSCRPEAPDSHWDALKKMRFDP